MRDQGILHLDGNFLQQLTLTFQVGKEAQPELKINTAGRPLSAVEHTGARDIGVSLAPFGSGFDCIAWGSVSGRATLAFNQTFLANAVDQFREELTKVITFADASGNPVFQTGIDIPVDAKDFALKTLARASALLFNNMFYGPDADLTPTRSVISWLASSERTVSLSPSRSLRAARLFPGPACTSAMLQRAQH